MSVDNSRYYKISTIVDDFLSDNDLHNSWYQKALKWGHKALRDIRLDIYQEVKTELLNVTERKTVVLPDGFVDWTKIAVKNGQYAVTLALNADLTIQERSTSDQTISSIMSQRLPNGTDFGQYGGYYFNNFNGSNFLAVGGGLPSKGFFKVVQHDNCKEILLDYDYNLNQVYLEYITDGLDACDETVVHPYEYNYIFAYMEMRYEMKNNPKATNYTKDEAQKDVYFEGLKLRGRYNELDPRTFITMSRAESRMTTKL
ncbi:MAG TPA: hypothetical protein VL443_24385 [Cyclobacteriaceae bacterium]|jgi:hypothetical protein|nr:hypothetical protein [Cyclobacteriaceae bacterium]